MLVLFRSLEDGSFVWIKHVTRLSVLSKTYEVFYQKDHTPLVEFYNFRFYSLQGICHEDL